ncbi:MAG: MotA/TolQ/ExbB proton channel family protein [Alphaproteobacteria bacterium]|nr:MAG: MotA/TolQ/ExbB proton channel family protein [Alphaproteobacteria bacterium]
MFLNSLYLRMISFIFLVCAILGYNWEVLQTIFLQNPILNGTIALVASIGIFLSFRYVRQFTPELKWLKSLTDETPTLKLLGKKPRLLSGLKDLLADEDSPITRTALTAVHEAVEAILVEQREIARYIMGVTIFLGLLGTFWGLSITLQSVSNVVVAMPTDANLGGDFLATLKAGLESPLSGMGIAFSSSLIGLFSSLVLGFLELHTHQARTRFLEHIGAWMNTNCIPSDEKLRTTSAESPQLLHALLTLTSENFESIVKAFTTQHNQQQILTHAVERLNDSLARVVDQRYAEHDVLLKVAENILSLQDSTTEFKEAIRTHNFGVDNATAAHIRSLEQSARQLVETTAQGNEALTRDIRSEIRILSRTLATIANHELAEEATVSSQASVKTTGVRKKMA